MSQFDIANFDFAVGSCLGTAKKSQTEFLVGFGQCKRLMRSQCNSTGNDLSLAGTAGAAAAGARQQKTGFVTGFKNSFSGFGLELLRRAGEFDRKRHNSFLLT